MRNWQKRIFWTVLALLGFLSSGPRFVEAQSNTLSIGILNPAENTTFYAGPTSLLYSTEITGWVTSNNPDPSLIQVRLEILRGARVVTDTTAWLRQDGTFSFNVTINPDATYGDFTIAEIENGCENCHYKANISLPDGKILLRLTAIEASGQQVIAKRTVTVDRSNYATVPVRVVHDEQLIPNVPVAGATRLYLWRSRQSKSITNNKGEAQLKVEALAQAPTHYIFSVEPTVVDGVLYQSIEPIELTLPPGVTSAPMVTLQVRGQSWKIGWKHYKQTRLAGFCSRDPIAEWKKIFDFDLRRWHI